MSDYSATFPSQRPVFSQDFAQSGKIDPRATFSRADTASSGNWSAFSNTPTLSNSTPGTTNQYYLISPGSTADLGAGPQSWTGGKYIQWNGSAWVQVDQPIGVTYWSNEKHLSNENLLLQSENFTTTWSTSEANGAAGATAPDGGTDAYTITCYTASSKAPRLNQSLSGKLSANTEYTMVGHVKAGTATHGYISFRGNNSNNYAYAQIEFASPGSVSTGGVGFTSISGTVTALGSSWYRLTLTATTGSDVSGAFAFLGPNDGTAFGISGYPIWDTAAETLVIWGAQISTTQAKFYDSPTTTQISRSYAPSLKYVTPATGGMARFEYDPTDGQSSGTSLGILLESQSTNLATYGSDLTNAAWNPLSAFIGGTAVGPDGTLSAVKLVASAGSSLYPRFRRLSLLTSTTQTFSIYVKPLEFQHLAISADGSASCLVQYNLSGSGAITSQTGATGSVEQCGNGWFRVSFSYTTVPNAHLAITMQSSTTYQTETGNGYDGMLFALAMLENSSQASSFIGTTSSTATRAADSLTMPIASTGYTGGPVTLLAESTTETDTTNPVTLALYANGDQQIFLYGNSANKRAAYVEADNTSSILTSTADANGVRALRVNTNDIATALNGTIDATDTSQTLPDLTGATVYIGDDSNGGNSIDGHIKRVAIYNEALSDTNLQAITS